MSILRPLAFVAATALLCALLISCACGGCCGDIGEDPNPGEVCDHMAEISGKKSGLSIKEREVCIRGVSERFLGDEETWSCFSNCVVKADSEKEGARCAEKCAAVGGVARLQVEKDLNKYPGGLQLVVRTKPKAKVTVELEPRSVGATLTAKAKKRTSKAKKSGKATFTYKSLPQGGYNVSIVSKEGDSDKKQKDDFYISKSAISLHGATSSGDKRNCYLKFERPRETIYATRDPIYGSGGKVSIEFRLADGDELVLDGKKTSFSKGRAKVDVSLENNIGNLSAKSANSSSASLKLPVTLKGRYAEWNGALHCGLPSLKIKAGQAMTFPGDSAKGDGSILVLAGKKVLGNPNAKLKDIDYIAAAEYKTRKVRACAYFDPNTNSRRSVAREANDKVWTLYERRTGKKIKSKKFRAPTPRCPTKLSPSTTILREYPSSSKVDDWLLKARR